MVIWSYGKRNAEGNFDLKQAEKAHKLMESRAAAAQDLAEKDEFKLWRAILPLLKPKENILNVTFFDAGNKEDRSIMS